MKILFTTVLLTGPSVAPPDPCPAICHGQKALQHRTIRSPPFGAYDLSFEPQGGALYERATRRFFSAIGELVLADVRGAGRISNAARSNPHRSGRLRRQYDR